VSDEIHAAYFAASIPAQRCVKPVCVDVPETSWVEPSHELETTGKRTGSSSEYVRLSKEMMELKRSIHRFSREIKTMF